MISPHRSTVVSNPILRALLYVWVLPNSILGLFVGVLGLASGGRCQIHRGCLEFSGGLVTWLLKRLGGAGVLAMTLGHTIIGQDEKGLANARDHEQVHVRQYELWGPLFLPAYLGCSAYLWLRKKDCYRGNPFEVQAYGIADPRSPKPNSIENKNDE